MKQPLLPMALRNPTPADEPRLLERADMIRRTRALEEQIRNAAPDEPFEPATTHSDGAEIAP